MKKWIALILCLCLAAGAVPAMTEEVSDIKYSEVPFYFLDTEKTGDLNVFFIGDSDVPYVSLADWTEILTMVMKVAYMDMGLSFRLKYTPEGQTGILTREDNYTMVVDCEKDTITFLDYDAFLRPEENRNLVDMLTAADSTDEKPTLFHRIAEFSYDRYGKELVLEAGKYGIDLVMARNVCMVPLMTLVDFTISGQGMIASYTKDKVIIATSSQLEDENNQITAMGELFRSGEQGPVSTAAADYNYAELCMVFDYMYGLKDAHGFTSFDALVDELGLRDALKSTEPEVSDVALRKLIAQDLDDQHSAVSMLSYRIDEKILEKLKEEGLSGFSGRAFTQHQNDYKKARETFYPGGVPVYEEVGNTAYITFDEFIKEKEKTYYYSNAPTENEKDTIGIMLYAYSQIMREGSPVENVVLDLSNNIGGSAEAAAAVLGAFLGDGYISVKNTMTGAISTAVFNVDMNLDHRFDEEDFGLLGKKLFCLTSPVSFSCGNLVPSVFKNSHRVTLIGDTSGGGSCVVLPLASLVGTVFQISSPFRISFSKNGSFYDTDLGVEPDFPIVNEVFLYDRPALTEYINNLK